MRIGLDLDGTVVLYDQVFHRYGVEQFGVPAGVAADKTAVRDWMRANEPGEEGWIELQRIVYGLRMEEAPVAPGIREFLAECRAAGIPVSVISHKTRYSVAVPRVDLHAAAREWLEGKRLELDPQRVFFEPTREEKIRRIAAEGCTLFVDDLEEVFAEPSFPRSVERWLYAPAGRKEADDGVRAFSDWAVLSRRARELAEERSAH